MLILFGDKIRSQTKPFLYLFQLVGAKDPVHEYPLGDDSLLCRHALCILIKPTFLKEVGESELFS